MEDEPVYDPMADDPTDEPEQGETPLDASYTEPVIIYEGACRAYNKYATSDKGEVVTSNRGLALPITKDGWTLDTVPREGDRVVVDRGGYEEYGTVIDKEPANFGGTHLIWKYGRV